MTYPAPAASMASYDRLISPAETIARVVYGAPQPLLRRGQHRDTEFYGRLFAELVNKHVVLAKVCKTESNARWAATQLRMEIPSEPFSVGVKQNADYPRDDEWFVLVYNRVYYRLEPPLEVAPALTDAEWVTTKEAGQILGLSRRHVTRCIIDYNIPHEIGNAYGLILLDRAALRVIANRSRKWKHRRKTAQRPYNPMLSHTRTK